MIDFLKKFFGHRATTRDVSGNVVIGDVSGIVFQTTVTGPPAEPLSLPWRDLATTPNVPIFNLLTWRSRLSQSLVGREDDQARLLAWARDDPRRIALRLLTGPGGAGKSRLAAEVAEELRKEGWSTGIVSLDKASTLPLSRCGLFVAIDYPEAQREAVRTLLRGVGRLENPPGKVRLLLVSRQHMDWWRDDLVAAQVNELSDGQDTNVGPLPANLTCTLVHDVASRLARVRGIPAPALDAAAISEWHARDPALHGLPLFATAAAVHAVVGADSTFLLAGTAIIEALVTRERVRLNMAAENAKWPEAKAASRLHGLAALRGGLDEQSLKHLAQTAPDIGLPVPDHVVDRVQALGWWTDGQVLAPQPDLVAAELLHQILEGRPQAAPGWLAATLADPDAIEVSRLGRLMHDIVTLHGESASSLDAWLVEAVERNPRLAKTWRSILDSDATPFRLASLAISIGHILLRAPDLEDSKRAGILNNLSNRLAGAGDKYAALTMIQEAVEIRRRLAKAEPARFEPDLALSLNNLSNRLRASRDHDAALRTIWESVEIRRRLAKADPVRFEPDLARSLSNLSLRLNKIGDRAAALKNAQEAVAIQRRARAVPSAIDPGLARYLHNLANRLSDAGDNDAALMMIQEAVEIRRRLVKTNPARFEPEFAAGLHNLSARLSDAGENDAALMMVKEAVAIRRRLAKADPVRFEPGLAISLRNLSARLSDAGDADAALMMIQEAVEIRRRLMKVIRQRGTSRLAGHHESYAKTH